MKKDTGHIPPELSGLKDTAPLREALLKLQAYRDAGEHGAALIKRIKGALRRMMWELSRLNMFNTKVWLKHEMLTDPGWRGRVLEDLGGDPALLRWEARKAKADVKIRAPRITPYVPQDDDAPLEKTRRKRKRVTLDREGQFRLAPIGYNVRPLTVPEQFARQEARQWQKLMEPKPKVKPVPRKRPTYEVPFRPIPVTPHELRGDALRRTKTWDEVRAEEAAYERREQEEIEFLLSVKAKQIHNPHSEADTSLDGSGTRRTRVMATEARTLRDALCAPQGEGFINEKPP